MELYSKIIGHGDPLVILHGLFGTSDNWMGLARQFAADHTVVLVDLRNHGRSPHHPEMTYAAMVEDMVRLLDKEWMHRVHMIGHSMGGKVAMNLALAHPDLVEKLMIVDIGVKAYPGGHETILEALQRLPIQDITSRTEAQEILQEWIKDEAVVQFLLKNLVRLPKGGFQWKMNLEAIALHYPQILARVDAQHEFDHPTLFVRGERSNYILDQDWSEIQSIFPNSELITIQNSGHWVHAEQPIPFSETVKTFFC
jgi:pimeloyl-ACP methyl ester carboxylesterase